MRRSTYRIVADQHNYTKQRWSDDSIQDCHVIEGIHRIHSIFLELARNSKTYRNDMENQNEPSGYAGYGQANIYGKMPSRGPAIICA